MNPGRSRLLLALAASALASCGSAESRGQRLYADRGCAVCHGPSGHGDGPTASRLDVPPRDLADPRAYRNGAGIADIARSIRNGSGGGMPPFRDLTESEAQDLAAWIVSLQSSSSGGRQ